MARQEPPQVGRDQNLQDRNKGAGGSEPARCSWPPEAGTEQLLHVRVSEDPLQKEFFLRCLTVADGDTRDIDADACDSPALWLGEVLQIVEKVGYHSPGFVNILNYRAAPQRRLFFYALQFTPPCGAIKAERNML